MSDEDRERVDYNVQQFRNAIALQFDRFRAQLADGVQHEIQNLQEDDQRCVSRIRFFCDGDHSIGFMTYTMNKNEDGSSMIDTTFAKVESDPRPIFRENQISAQA